MGDVVRLPVKSPNVLILSPYPERIASYITDPVKTTTETQIGPELAWADFVISYGYRHIIRDKSVFKHFGNRIINLHIAYLPWNRGADPVYWAVRDKTPFGVTIHVMTEGVDTGPILAQRELDIRPTGPFFDHPETLKDIYDLHTEAMVDLFAETWPKIRDGKIKPRPQRGEGSFHRKRDKENDVVGSCLKSA